MKKHKNFIIIFVLCAVLFSCGQQPKESGLVKVDKSKVITSNEADLPDYWSLPEFPQNSYAITQTQTYEKWTRTFAVYYPQFINEIEYMGSEDIKNYYAELAKKAKEKLKNWEMEDTVIDAATQHDFFYYQTYETEFSGIYLSVLYLGVEYMGGAHPLESFLSDNFDMTTGKILTLEDVFGDAEKYRPVLNKAICKNLLPQKEKLLRVNFEEVDIISHANNLQFRIKDYGIEFIFQIYEIAPYSSGAIFVTVPYEDLSGILKIKMEEINHDGIDG